MRTCSERIAVRAQKENLRRLGWFACLLVPLSLLRVTTAWLDEVPAGLFDPVALTRWKEAVVIVHLAMIANLLAVGVLIARVRRQAVGASRVFPSVLEAWGLVSALGFMIVVASIDQWVSSSIAPFLIGCVLVGSVFLLRAPHAALLYTVAFVAFAWALGLNRVDEARLLSHQVDGLIAAGLGFGVSQMIWRKHLLKESLVVELEASRAALQARDSELQATVVRDPLTGVWNRAELTRLALRELTRTQRHGGETCFIMVRLDNLEALRDRWGPATCEWLLTGVARLLQDELRTTDEVGRIGEDTFAVLLPLTSLELARQLAARLHQAIDRLRLPAAGGQAVAGSGAVGVSASLGVASQCGRALVPVPQQLEGLFGAAQQALAPLREPGCDRVVRAPLATPV